uniref:Arrestin_C domain-containing protein n=1 Tax=Macrostomum lignano TaxID=282301 RepID=A0A1I8GWQ7_9PLAT
MKVQVFDIIFDDADVNLNAVYRPGQFIKFAIHLNLLEPTKCKAVYVGLFGDSSVHWTEQVQSGGDDSSETVHYSSQEKYIDETVYIYTNHHPAGEFIYPVSFQLLPTAPASFESSIGNIRYYIQARMDRSWNKSNMVKKFFTVIRDFDLNLCRPEEIGPYNATGEFNVTCNACICFNCSSCYGKVLVRVELPKKAFVPGEHVHVTGEISNFSKTALQSVKLEIYQVPSYILPIPPWLLKG